MQSDGHWTKAVHNSKAPGWPDLLVGVKEWGMAVLECKLVPRSPNGSRWGEVTVHETLHHPVTAQQIDFLKDVQQRVGGPQVAFIVVFAEKGDGPTRKLDRAWFIPAQHYSLKLTWAKMSAISQFHDALVGREIARTIKTWGKIK